MLKSKSLEKEFPRGWKESAKWPEVLGSRNCEEGGNLTEGRREATLRGCWSPAGGLEVEVDSELILELELEVDVR